MTNVERITPVTVLPYSCFSPYAPYASRVVLSTSLTSGNVNMSRSRNLASFSGLSGEMPTTWYPDFVREASESRKSHACLVQPGVMAAGYAYRITFLPRRPDRESLDPSSVGRSKSGAGSPGASLTVMSATLLPGLSRHFEHTRQPK